MLPFSTPRISIECSLIKKFTDYFAERGADMIH